MKRPAFQFYPADWRNDAGLKLCSLAARGLWIEMICIMHAAEPYGHLCAAGRPLDARDLSKLVGESERDVKRWIDELVRNNVCSVEEGAFVSRRMVRDEQLRERRAAGGEAGSEFGHLGAEHGKKGGRPRKVTGDKKPPLNPPPSSSSSSSSITPPIPPEGVDVGGGEKSLFDEFWCVYPKRVGKDDARKKFEKRKFTASDMPKLLAAIATQSQSEQWRKDDGKFIPHPATWLHQARWLDDVIDGTTADENKPDWAINAGFSNRWEAENEGCREHNAHLFSNGKRTEVAA